jgi:hypothetical protein
MKKTTFIKVLAIAIVPGAVPLAVAYYLYRLVKKSKQ